MALAALTLSACGSKGEKGDAGPAGPAGPQGGLHPAPQIEAVSPPFVTRSQQIAVFGSGFDTDFAANRVYVGNHQATILDGDATTLIVTASVPVDIIDDISSLLVTVVSHNQTSNPYEVLQIPPGLPFQLGQASAAGFVTGLSLDTNGDQLITIAGLFSGSRTNIVNRVASATGNVTTEVAFTPDVLSLPGPTWKRTDGHYQLINDLDNGGTKLLRLSSQGEQQLVFSSPGIRGSEGAWDAAGNLYYIQNDLFFGSTTTIQKWDRVAKTVTTFRTSAADVTGVAVLGDFLYASTAAGQIEKIELANNLNVTTLIAAPIAGTVTSLGTDGTDLLSWANSDNANGFELTKFDTAGAATIFSDLDLSLVGGRAMGLFVDAGGRWHVGNYILGSYRVPNDTTKEAWFTSTNAGGTTFGALGDRLFVASPFMCNFDPDSIGGTVYELATDGSLRRVSSTACPTDYVFGQSGGKLVQYNDVTTAFEKVDPDTGVVTILFDVDDTVPELNGNVQEIATDAAGNVYAAYLDNGLGEHSIAKISAAGVLTDDFILMPNFESISAMVVQGSRLVISDDNSYSFLEAPIGAGGTATYIDQAVLFYSYGMTVGASGDVLLIDGDTGSLMFLRPDNTFEHRYTATLSSGAYYYEDELGYLYGFDDFQNFTVVLP